MGFQNMKTMRFYNMTLLFNLFSALLFVVGCGDSVEDSDANILDPTSADVHFQNLPLAGGSLIPLDEIPVVTIEKTREDDDFYYWQLKANPDPIHEDLVVGVRINAKSSNTIPIKLRDVSQYTGSYPYWVRKPGLDNLEYRVKYDQEARTLIHFSISTLFNNEGYFNHNDFQNLQLIVAVIPKFQNTSQEFKLPQSYVLKENTLVWSNIKIVDLDGTEGDRDVKGRVVEDVVMDIEYKLEVTSFVNMAATIAEDGFVSVDDSLNEHGDDAPPIFAVMDIPIFQTFEGYIIREGFAFPYYMFDESSSLKLKPPPDPE